MSLSDVSIRNPVFAWMLMAAILVFGWISFSRLGVSQMPDVDFPVLNVSVSLEGAAPEIVETTVVEVLEDAVMSIDGLKSINSSSKQGQGSITLEFDIKKNIDVALQEVQTKVAQAQRRLPADIDPPVISKSNPEDQPIMWLALTYDKDDPIFLMRYAREQLQDRFTTVAGVGQLVLGGYVDPALRVWVRPADLERYNIGVNDIINAIRTEHSEQPGGLIEEGSKAFSVRTMGEAQNLDEFKALNISRRGGMMVQDPTNMLPISRVARVEEGLNEVRRISRYNGRTALGLGIIKQRGTNAVKVAELVRDRAAEVQKDLPPGMRVDLNFDSTRFIDHSIRELQKHLILAVILTSLVCLFFLGSWSATFNVLLSIPTSIFGAFIGMYFFNFTLNTFTLLGLTLAIGIVVDDAIMVLENIFRYQSMKKNRVESALRGAREISFAALAATVAVVAIFLPVAFMKGVIGVFFMQFGVTISLAVMFSLLEALTITPMRAAQLSTAPGERRTRIGRAIESGMRWLETGYAGVLVAVLRRKYWVIGGSFLFMGLSFSLVRWIPKEAAPAQDQSIFLMRMQTPAGSSLQYTDEKVRAVEAWLKTRVEVARSFVSVGGFSGGAGDGNTAIGFITLVPKNERELSQQEFMDQARRELAKVPDLRVFMQDLSMRGFTSGRGMPVEFNITGPAWDVLASSAEKIQAEMSSSGLMQDVDSNYLLGMPEIRIRPDRVAAAQHGVSITDIGSTINALIGGLRVGEYQSGGRRYDIRLQLDKGGEGLRAEEIGRLNLNNARGNLVPLSRLVTVREERALQQISRVDRARAIRITANLQKGVSQQQALGAAEEIARRNLPPGYRYRSEGSSQALGETFQSLWFALVLGILVAYMVLAAQFNSFLDPVTILMALPFAIGGALFALLITFQSLNMYSLIGILLLMGIVKKNSILLVEFTNHRRLQKGLSAREALVDACPIRLRPILMTSFATIAAAIPTALATGDGSEVFRPMSITIIGGVLLSTLLTLFVVPAVYLSLDRLRRSDRSDREIKAAFEAAVRASI